MPRKSIACDSYVFDALIFDKYQSGETNRSECRKKLDFVYKAMKSELTAIQFQSLKEYYVNGKKIKDIAAERGVAPSTVSRQIKRAKDKITRIAKYY